MKKFKIIYMINDKQKQTFLKAKNTYEARMQALKKYHTIVEIQELEEKQRAKFKEEELIFIFKDLNMILKAGLSLQEAVLEFCNNAYDQKITHNFKIIYKKLKNGTSYDDAFSGILNSTELAMLKICNGKEDLSKAFDIIIALKEKRLKNYKQFKKAISYPLLVLVCILFAFGVLMVFVLPEFKALFEQLELNLPLITRILFAIGDFINNFYIFIAVFFLLILWLFFLYKNSYLFDKLCFYMPIFGKLISYQDKFCFFLILSHLLNSGVDIKKALNLANNGVKNKFLNTKIANAIYLFESGLTLSQAFLKIEIFENFVIRMLNLSFKSSNLDESSYELALFFENKKEEYMQRLFVLLEPLMVFFMAGLILILALGVFLPMWQISHGF
ncbi:type II secretion system F family protein [Campylobacter peloridis]|nr:type II secretion system F family protein [Campylobacter peloridis]